jgi:hypothetical protein
MCVDEAGARQHVRLRELKSAFSDVRQGWRVCRGYASALPHRLCSPSPPLIISQPRPRILAPSISLLPHPLTRTPYPCAPPATPTSHHRPYFTVWPKTRHLSNACRQKGVRRVRQQPLRVATCWSCACPGCLLIRCNASLRSNCDSCNPSMRPYVSNACLCTIAWSMRVHTN